MEVVLGIEFRTLCLPSTRSTTEVPPAPLHTWFGISAPSFTGCVTWGQLPNLPVPWFPFFRKGTTVRVPLSVTGKVDQGGMQQVLRTVQVGGRAL